MVAASRRVEGRRGEALGEYALQDAGVYAAGRSEQHSPHTDRLDAVMAEDAPAQAAHPQAEATPTLRELLLDSCLITCVDCPREGVFAVQRGIDFRGQYATWWASSTSDGINFEHGRHLIDRSCAGGQVRIFASQPLLDPSVIRNCWATMRPDAHIVDDMPSAPPLAMPPRLPRVTGRGQFGC